MHPTFEKAKSLLVMQQPFFATLFLHLRVRDASEAPVLVDTMAVDGTNLYVADSFVDTLSLEHCTNVLVHEVCHIAFGHHLRLAELVSEKKWDLTSDIVELWNIATDYAINLQLRDKESLSLPSPHLYDQKWEGADAEEIFHKLLDDASLRPRAGGQSMGSVLPFPGEDGAPTAEELANARMDIKANLLQAAMAAKQMGHMPGSMVDLIGKLTESKADWRAELWEFVASSRVNGYDWARPNRRYTTAPFVLPSRGSTGLPALNFILDVSGSVSAAMATRLISEAKGAIEAFDVQDIVFVQCDTRVTSITEDLDVGSLQTMRLRGRGGTDMNPAFDALRDLRPAPTILLSDMEIPTLRPFPHPVLFCRVGSGRGYPGAGRLIDVN